MSTNLRFAFRCLGGALLWIWLSGCAVNIYRYPCKCTDTVYVTIPRPDPDFTKPNWNLRIRLDTLPHNYYHIVIKSAPVVGVP